MSLENMNSKEESGTTAENRDDPHARVAVGRSQKLGGIDSETRTGLQGVLRAQLSDGNLPGLLAAAFAESRPESAANLLKSRFLANGTVSVDLSSDLSNPCVILVRKRGPRELHLTFSKKLSKYDQLHTQAIWLTWVMPLLARAALSDRVPAGMAFLNQWEAGIVPGLAYCAADDDSFLIPDNVFMPSAGYKDLKFDLAQNPVPWKDRKPTAFWRGSTTGQVQDPARGWRSLQRVGLSWLSTQHPKLLDAGLSAIVQWPEHVAEQIRQSGLMKDYFPAAKLHNFKYLIDVDGNSSAWGGLFERLLTGSPVLKVASPRRYRQWYYDRLRPWHHFIPVAADMSDLMDKIQWCVANDAAARLIGENGRALAISMDYDSEMERGLDAVAAAFRSFSVSRYATLKTGSQPKQRLVLTDHGTIVAYQRKTGVLVHVKPESALLGAGYLPVFLAEDGSNAYLRLQTGQFIVKIGPNGRPTFSRMPPKPDNIFLTGLKQALESDASYSFLQGGLYVCAESDGRITVSRAVASTWELFSSRQK